MILDAHVNAPEKPFFMYYATGCGHAPHHVPKEWADKYAGRFDDGLGRLPREGLRTTEGARHRARRTRSCRPAIPTYPSGSRCRREEQRLYARFMEVYAGFVCFTDHHFGRILDTLEQIGELDNTSSWCSRTTAPRPRVGRSGLDERDAVLQQRARVARGQPGRNRHAGRTALLQPLPVGLGLGRRHAVPPLEARDLSGRLDRPVRHGLAEGHAGARRGP